MVMRLTENSDFDKKIWRIDRFFTYSAAIVTLTDTILICSYIIHLFL